MSTRVNIGEDGVLSDYPDVVIRTVVDAHTEALDLYQQRPLKVFTASIVDERLLALCVQWLTYYTTTLPARVFQQVDGQWREVDEGWLMAQAQRYSAGQALETDGEYRP